MAAGHRQVAVLVGMLCYSCGLDNIFYTAWLPYAGLSLSACWSLPLVGVLPTCVGSSMSWNQHTSWLNPNPKPRTMSCSLHVGVTCCSQSIAHLVEQHFSNLVLIKFRQKGISCIIGNVMSNGKWCIYITLLSKALYRDCALHSPIHTPMVEETIQGTNLLTRSN